MLGLVQATIYGALTWAMLELTKAYLGRGPAWTLGFAILLVVTTALANQTRHRQSPTPRANKGLR
jgi:hypothetical protein